MRQNLRHVDEFPHEVEVIEHLTIPMPDGVRLAAKLWRPKDAVSHPVPAILEYIPYRKRDGTAIRDSMMHGYFAGHGYACLRVDLRGSGESEGVLQDEYLAQELDDGVEVIRWLADQPWCDGNVGMIGISWGGFNGLQIAARTPPELKCIITASSTDDRYADDVHYMGGCLLGDNLSWASVMFSYNASPPDPALVGEAWREMWLQRLQGAGLWLDTWLRHQRRDDYWQHGSVCEDFARIACPVYAVSGWADGYSNAVFRLLDNLTVPRKGLIGPWSHLYPHVGEPGPAIGFLQEALRWWDQWLKGVDTGIMDEPMLRCWMQDPAPPSTTYEHRPGHWVGEHAWPSPDTETKRLVLGRNWLVEEGDEVTVEPLSVQSPLSTGLYAGKWCSYSHAPDLPYDQRLEDGGSLVFNAVPLTEGFCILGAPEVDLALESDKPIAMIAVRLSRLDENDRATRISYGLLNLAHRDGHERPQPLEPGRTYRVRVRMNDVAQRFHAGDRLRLAISTSYWPLAWPAPEPARLTITAGESFLELPVRPIRPEDHALPSFGPAEAATPVRTRLTRPPQHDWRVTHDLSNHEARLEVVKDEGTLLFEDIGLALSRVERESYSIIGERIDTVRGETHCERVYQRDDWSVRTVARTVLTSDSRDFRIQADLDAYEGDSRVFSRTWDRKIPRDHM